jgi:hypothetical protein
VRVCTGPRAVRLRFAISGRDRFGCVDEERLEGAAVILRAIDLTIAEVELREDGGDRQDQLQTLRYMRERWLEKAEEERGR